ncbi:hypothetical protein BLOT_001631 [Blomia tropicalis]|nr:hypothetical protein BLOT_001631 [Blomia tropicalis]
MAALKEDSILFFFWDAIFDYIALTLLLTVPNGTLSVTTKQTKNEKNICDAMESIKSNEKMRLWNLFQACDHDHDGLINVDDIRRYCQRTEMCDYTPEAMLKLFDIAEGTRLTFEDFVNKKIAHDQLTFPQGDNSVSDSDDYDTQTFLDNGSWTSTHINQYNDLNQYQPWNLDQYDDSLWNYSRNNLDYGMNGIDSNLINYLNDLSVENENINTELQRIINERDYLRETIQNLQENCNLKFEREKRNWNNERQQLMEKIFYLQTILNNNNY